MGFFFLFYLTYNITNQNSRIMSLKVFDPHYKTTLEYKAKIEPIKQGDKFLPNYKEREKTFCFMLKADFERYQRQGETILINNAGGWCTLRSDMKIVQE